MVAWIDLEAVRDVSFGKEPQNPFRADSHTAHDRVFRVAFVVPERK